MPLDVICPGCRDVFFETNDEDGVNPHVIIAPGSMPAGKRSVLVRKYEPDKPANAAMIQMKSKFISVHDDIIHHVSRLHAAFPHGDARAVGALPRMAK